MVGRVEIEADDVADLLAKKGSVASWKCFCRLGWRLNAVQRRWTVDFDSPVVSAMARQVQCVPPPGCLASSVFCSSIMRVSVRDGARPARTGFVVQTFEAMGAEASALPADRLATDAGPLAHRRVVQAPGAQQHDPGTAHQARG